MSNNLASLLAGGPAKVTFGGVSLLTKAGINAEPALNTFAVETDQHGEVDQRLGSGNILLPFTPAGIWGDIAALFRVLTARSGDYIVPVLPVAEIDTGTNVITAYDHGLQTEDSVYVSGAGDYTLPAAVAEGTLYYVRRLSADTLTLHDTAVHATANTNVVDFADDGTGQIALVLEQNLVVHTTRGKKITFYNAAVVGLPSLELSATKTIFGEVRFEIFRRHNKAWGDEESLYKVEDEAYTDDSFDPADILTQPYEASWGTDAPWSAITTENGFKVDWGLALSEKGNDTEGAINRQFDKLAPTATFIPIGIGEADLLDKLQLQGAGTARGQSLSAGGADLVITGTGVYVVLYNAAPTKGSLRFNRKDYRAGDVTLAATNGGVANAVLAYVGTAAP